MKTVSVVCIYYNHNYGSVLQSLALNLYLEKQGYRVQIVPFRDCPGKKEKLRVLLGLKLPKLFDAGIVKRKLQERKNARVYAEEDNIYMNGRELRNKTYERFIKAHFEVPEHDLERSQLPEFVKDSDAVIVGSDQLWTPHDILIGYHTLSFVPDSVRRISYATSFGVSELPNAYLRRKATAFLKKMDVISVREQQGKKIIDDLHIGKEVHVVADPTMLLSRQDWDELLPKKRIVQEKYIFCYFLGNNPEHRALAQEFRKKTGLKILALQHMDEYIQSDRDFADEALYDIDPVQYAALIRDAEYVLTDSFHGSVFSILYQKKFFVMNRHRDTEVRSTNSRIETLCSTLGLSDRRILSFDNPDIDALIDKDIHYDDVFTKLRRLKAASEQFLKQALQ